MNQHALTVAISVLAVVGATVPAARASDASHQRLPTRQYRVIISTGDLKGAGTDADVYLTIFGGDGSATREVLLDNHENNHERGDIDTYSFEFADLGDISAIRVRHDDGGDRPGWFLDSVRIIDESSGTEMVFPVHRWLARDEDDSKIDRLIYRSN